MKLDCTAHGVYAIAATPFLPDGRLDSVSIDRMTDFYVSCGASRPTWETRHAVTSAGHCHHHGRSRRDWP